MKVLVTRGRRSHHRRLGRSDACTQLLLDVFGDTANHARTSVGMASLPFGTAIEIDMVVALANECEQ
jgi:enamine deaminase RidA (YjgF/YER057c/UK114 family)